jgi:hypothetical protein
MKAILINAGYVAFNGHVFTEAEANSYNQACRDAERNPSDFNLDQRHRVFASIIQSWQKAELGERYLVQIWQDGELFDFIRTDNDNLAWQIYSEFCNDLQLTGNKAYVEIWDRDRLLNDRMVYNDAKTA